MFESIGGPSDIHSIMHGLLIRTPLIQIPSWILHPLWQGTVEAPLSGFRLYIADAKKEFWTLEAVVSPSPASVTCQFCRDCSSECVWSQRMTARVAQYMGVVSFKGVHCASVHGCIIQHWSQSATKLTGSLLCFDFNIQFSSMSTKASVSENWAIFTLQIERWQSAIPSYVAGSENVQLFMDTRQIYRIVWAKLTSRFLWRWPCDSSPSQQVNRKLRGALCGDAISSGCFAITSR